MVDLRGRTALVTGGAQGIGAASARGLAAAGAAVAIAYETSASAAERLAASIIGGGGRAVAVRADLSRAEQASELVQQATDALGPATILVNSAAVVEAVAWDELTPEHIDRSFGLNVRAPLLLAQAFARQVVTSGAKGGSVVNISSLNGRAPAKGAVVYSATKAALDALTRGLAAELGAIGVRVNAIAPGLTASERRLATLDAETERAVVGRTPLGRLGTPEDIAKAVVFLASDDAGWITGEVIAVGGGLGL